MSRIEKIRGYVSDGVEKKADGVTYVIDIDHVAYLLSLLDKAEKMAWRNIVQIRGRGVNKPRWVYDIVERAEKFLEESKK